ncbi:unnamed protein product, partial [Allacma fusca]
MIIDVILFVGVLLFSWIYFRDTKYSKSKLPPKVPGALPILGHLLALGDFPCKVLL